MQNYYTALDLVYFFLTFKLKAIHSYTPVFQSTMLCKVFILGDAFHPYTSL